MNKKQDDINQHTTSRRTRQQSRKNSPNSKLLNAAWPKAPSNPARKSHIKAVDHDPFKKSWNEWRQQNSECAVEDMEIDVDTNNDEITKNISSSSLSKKTTSPKQALQTNQQKPITSSSKHEDEKQLASPDSRRPRKSQGDGVEDVKKNTNKKKLVHSSKSHSNKEIISRRSSTTPNSSLYIVIHVSEVTFGSCKGPATTPVKVYADKFIIQMEDSTTKKEISFRVPCKNILSLDLSLQNKPFRIEFTTRAVHYISAPPPQTRKSKGGEELKKVILQLGYEGSVPQDVKDDLRELFEVRLADQKLWHEEKPVTTTKDSTTNSNEDEGEREEEKAVSDAEAQYDPPSNDPPSNDSPSREKEKTYKEKEIKEPSQQRKILPSVRKRTPLKEKIDETKDELEPSTQKKVARRCDFERNDALHERIKTLEHEAAHYQMISAQQRMIIQRLEATAQMSAQKAEDDSIMLKQQHDQLSEDYENKNLELTGILNNLKIEKDLVKALESQIEFYRKELDTKNGVIVEKDAALQVREDTILQLRGRVRRLSTTEKKEVSSNESTNKQMVPMSHLEEIRRQLIQVEMSKARMTNDLEQTRMELSEKNSEINQMCRQYETSQDECMSRQETISKLRSDYQTAQNVVELKNEQIRRMEASSSAQNDHRVEELRNELSDSNILNEELRSEINDLKSQMEDINRELTTDPNSNQQTLSRDWILERREIMLTERILGTGAWGNVKVGNFRGTEVAVKQIHHLILSPHNRRLFEREMAIASRCRHPCLVQFIGATNDDGTPLFVMELLTTDLRTVLSHDPLSRSNCLNIGYDIIKAIVYLHKSKPVPIIHRDISSSNVLLYRGQSNGWRAKLSDYGAANFLRLSMTRHPGGLLYSAPEASTMDQTTKLDVYSFGVLFCEMCTRELPVPENRCDQIRNVQNSDYRTLINNCLRRDVAKRLESEAVLQTFERWSKPI